MPHLSEGKRMSRDGARNLIAAVAKAMGRTKLNVNSFKDRLLMQKGCFVLNRMGVDPKYRFDLYIRGPYSSELAGDYYDLLNGTGMTYETDVDPGHIRELSVLIDKGTPFLEAYATLGLVLSYNPGLDTDRLIEFVTDMKPHLKKEIREASEYRINGQFVI